MKTTTIAMLLIAAGVLGLFFLDQFYPPAYTISPSDFNSNGERIYFTSTSNSGKPITSTIGSMAMRGGMMTCAFCHGTDGKGGSGRMMMWVYEAPDIRYSSLTTGQEGEAPYTDDLIKRAITKGVDSEGKRLEPPMPMWQMSEEDLNDLISFLKTLK